MRMDVMKIGNKLLIFACIFFIMTTGSGAISSSSSSSEELPKFSKIRPFMSFLAENATTDKLLEYLNRLLLSGDTQAGAEFVHSLWFTIDQAGAEVLDVIYYRACVNGYRKVLKTLIDHHPNRQDMTWSTLQDESGDTLLHCAVRHRQIHIINYLLNDLNESETLIKDLVLAGNNQGDTALHIASSEGFEDIVKVLLAWAQSKGICWEFLIKQNKDGSTALHKATTLSTIVEQLIDAARYEEENSFDTITDKVKEFITIHNNSGYTAMFLAPKVVAHYLQHMTNSSRYPVIPSRSGYLEIKTSDS